MPILPVLDDSALKTAIERQAPYVHVIKVEDAGLPNFRKVTLDGGQTIYVTRDGRFFVFNIITRRYMQPQIPPAARQVDPGVSPEQNPSQTSNSQEDSQ